MDELSGKSEQFEALLDAADEQPILLIDAAKDETHNNAVVFNNHIENTSSLRLRFRHFPRIKSILELVSGQEVFLLTEFADGLTGLEGFLRQRGRLFVTNQWIETGAHRQRLFHRGVASFLVRFHAIEAEFDEGSTTAIEQPD
tara:strand:+ start:584 stop:1012 length:429 start_codon:yes stop_codon:yes gene_type:complete